MNLANPLDRKCLELEFRLISAIILRFYWHFGVSINREIRHLDHDPKTNSIIQLLLRLGRHGNSDIMIKSVCCKGRYGVQKARRNATHNNVMHKRFINSCVVVGRVDVMLPHFIVIVQHMKQPNYV